MNATHFATGTCLPLHPTPCLFRCPETLTCTPWGHCRCPHMPPVTHWLSAFPLIRTPSPDTTRS